MWIANTGSKVYHTPGCHHAARIQQDRQIQYRRESLAVLDGYRPCKCCCSIESLYEAQEQALQAFCEQNGLQQYYQRNRVYIISNEDTAWYICRNGCKKTDIVLWHESMRGHIYIRQNQPYNLRNYHRQNRREKDLAGYAAYILQHDAYIEQAYEQRLQRQTCPQAKRRQSKRQKAAERRRSIGRVLGLINNMNDDLTVPRAAML